MTVHAKMRPDGHAMPVSEVNGAAQGAILFQFFHEFYVLRPHLTSIGLSAEPGDARVMTLIFDNTASTTPKDVFYPFLQMQL